MLCGPYYEGVLYGVWHTAGYVLCAVWHTVGCVVCRIVPLGPACAGASEELSAAEVGAESPALASEHAGIWPGPLDMPFDITEGFF